MPLTPLEASYLFFTASVSHRAPSVRRIPRSPQDLNIWFNCIPTPALTQSVPAI